MRRDSGFCQAARPRPPGGEKAAERRRTVNPCGAAHLAGRSVGQSVMLFIFHTVMDWTTEPSPQTCSPRESLRTS